MKEDVNSRMSDMEIRISEQLAKEIHETQEQVSEVLSINSVSVIKLLQTVVDLP